MGEVVAEFSSREAVGEEFKQAPAAAEDVEEDEEDFTGMPELCDNKNSTVEAKIVEENASAVSSGDTTESTKSSGKVGEWDDILGSGR